jgi:cytochrome P450
MTRISDFNGYLVIDDFFFCFFQTQDKIAEEQNVIFGTSKRQATLEDMAKMKYLERVVKEAMRLYPPVPMFSRTLSEDLEIGEFFF